MCEKKKLCMYVYIACAHIYQNTRMVHNPSVLVAAQLKLFSMLPFRHVPLLSLDFTLRNSAICCSDLTFRLSVLQMLKKVLSQRPPLLSHSRLKGIF